MKRFENPILVTLPTYFGLKPEDAAANAECVKEMV